MARLNIAIVRRNLISFTVLHYSVGEHSFSITQLKECCTDRVRVGSGGKPVCRNLNGTEDGNLG